MTKHYCVWCLPLKLIGKRAIKVVYARCGVCKKKSIVYIWGE